jgi:hypothetical protein
MSHSITSKALTNNNIKVFLFVITETILKHFLVLSYCVNMSQVPGKCEVRYFGDNGKVDLKYMIKGLIFRGLFF